MKTIATLATLISCPQRFVPTFQQFPNFSVVLHDDNSLSFEDVTSGEWFLNTTKVQNMDDNGLDVTVRTTNSVYVFRRCVEAEPVSDLKSNEFYKVVTTAYELHEVCPKWAKEYAVMPDGTCMVKIWLVEFCKDELEAMNIIANAKANMNFVGSDEIDFANQNGYLSVVGMFKTSFDEDFLNKAEQWRKRIFSYNEFAFELRRRDRKQMREELAPAWLDKRERLDKLDYLRWYTSSM